MVSKKNLNEIISKEKAENNENSGVCGDIKRELFLVSSSTFE